MKETARTFSTGDVARILWIPPRTVDRWIREGVITPTIETTGKGKHRRFPLVPDVLAMATGRGMRASGLGMEAAAVMVFLMRQTEENLLEAFADGRTAVMVVGDDVLPRFVDPVAIVSNTNIDYAAAKTIGVLPIGIDVARVYGNLIAMIEEKPTGEGSAKEAAVSCG